MSARPQGMIGYATLGLVVAALGLVAFRASRRDVDFSRRVFTQLVEGKPAVQNAIAWDRLQAVGKDVGQEYQALQDSYQRTKYQTAFVESFAKGFRQSGADPTAFEDWRIYARGEDETIVAANHPNHRQVLLFSISKRRPRQLQAIQILDRLSSAATDAPGRG